MAQTCQRTECSLWTAQHSPTALTVSTPIGGSGREASPDVCHGARGKRVWPCRCSGLLRRWWGRGVGLPEAELVAVRVRAGREPAHAGNRRRLACLPAELVHPRRPRVDVVDREVGPGAAFARLHVGDRRALLPADLRGVVLERAGVGLELPPEQRAPELLALAGVVGRDLDVHDFTWHRCLLGLPLTAMPPPGLTPPDRRTLTGRCPDAGSFGYFRTSDRI